MTYRINAVSSQLKSTGHALLIFSPASRKYLTDFTSSDGIVVVVKEKAYFLIDGRYYEKAAEVVKSCKVALLTDFKEQVGFLFKKHDIKTVSIEANEISVGKLAELQDKFPQIKFDASVWLSDILEKQRIIKTEIELKRIETAQRIAERAYGKLLTKLKPGLTEKQVAALLTYYMLELGADDIAFPIIAASGKNSALPHAEPSNKKLEAGEFLVLDFGARVNGYNSDMTRTVAIGEPTAEMKRVYEAVLAANNDGLKAVRADVSGKLVDNVARSTLEAWGYDKYFTHSLGHGVGLNVHEKPTLAAKSDSMLKQGMVVTIEPGVYIPHKFGVRIEDMVAVTESGCINITRVPKNLVCKHADI